MNKLLADYQNDILILFKAHYRRLVIKNLNITFNDIAQSLFMELNIKNFTNEEVGYLQEWFNFIHYQNFLHPFFKEHFDEIIFHSHQHTQIIRADQKLYIENTLLNPDDFLLSLEILALKNHIEWNFKNPFASFNLNIAENYYRATLIHYSTSANGQSKFFLRKIINTAPTLELFDLNSDLKDLLISLIEKKENVLISGSTGSGKTTLIRSLINHIPIDEHLITLEDTYEIINTHPRQTSFLAHKNQDQKSLKDYCAYSLRMSPDRLIVGEMRSDEVVPFLLAMNTGHRGLMSTIHANSAPDALSRVALLFSLYAKTSELEFSTITKLVCKNINYVIHIEKKKIKEICHVLGSDGEIPFFERIYSNDFN